MDPIPQLVSASQHKCCTGKNLRPAARLRCLPRRPTWTQLVEGADVLIESLPAAPMPSDLHDRSSRGASCGCGPAGTSSTGRGRRPGAPGRYARDAWDFIPAGTPRHTNRNRVGPSGPPPQPGAQGPGPASRRRRMGSEAGRLLEEIAHRIGAGPGLFAIRPGGAAVAGRGWVGLSDSSRSSRYRYRMHRPRTSPGTPTSRRTSRRRSLPGRASARHPWGS